MKRIADSSRITRAGALLVLAVGALMLALAAPASTQTQEPTPCGKLPAGGEAASRLRVVGDHMEDSDGSPVVPYGISLVAGPEENHWAQTEPAAAAQIAASQRFWHANTVRIQVSESQLFDHPTAGYGYNAAFGASVDRLVCMALRQGQIPVVNDTTLFTAPERGPTQRTVRFWQFMSRR